MEYVDPPTGEHYLPLRFPIRQIP